MKVKQGGGVVTEKGMVIVFTMVCRYLMGGGRKFHLGGGGLPTTVRENLEIIIAPHLS